MCVCVGFARVYYFDGAPQLVDLPTDALLSHLNYNGVSSSDAPPLAISPFDPATSYYQMVVDDVNLNNNNYAPLKVMPRRPLSVIHEESLFNHFL